MCSRENNKDKKDKTFLRHSYAQTQTFFDKVALLNSVYCAVLKYYTFARFY